MLWKHETKHCNFISLIMGSLCSFGGMKSFLICSGSHFCCRLPSSSVSAPRADIILIYKYNTWFFVVWHTKMNTHCHARHKFISVDTQTCRISLDVLWCLMNTQNPCFVFCPPKALMKESFVSDLGTFKEHVRYWLMCGSRKGFILCI